MPFVFRGDNLLFADADGATTFCDLTKLERCLEEITKEEEGLVCGSRAHLEQESVAQRTAIRTLLMYGFHACVWLFAVKTVKDTQCGFKVRNYYKMLTIIFLFSSSKERLPGRCSKLCILRDGLLMWKC